MLQVVASHTIIILMTLKLSFTLLENIYNTGVTNEDCHVMIKIFLRAGHMVQHNDMKHNDTQQNDFHPNNKYVGDMQPVVG